MTEHPKFPLSDAELETFSDLCREHGIEIVPFEYDGYKFGLGPFYAEVTPGIEDDVEASIYVEHSEIEFAVTCCWLLLKRDDLVDAYRKYSHDRHQPEALIDILKTGVKLLVDIAASGLTPTDFAKAQVEYELRASIEMSITATKAVKIAHDAYNHVIALWRAQGL